jgi:uncharacterized protein (DUF305 family)
MKTKTILHLLALFAGAIILPPPRAFAHEHTASAGEAPAQSEFYQAMDGAMTAMDRGMSEAKPTGDIDHDFAAMMIPHHQGAIDMAKGEILFGKNPVLRRLA